MEAVLLLAAILALRHYLITRPSRFKPYALKLGRRSVIVLGALLGASLVLVPVFEAYFALFECEVSEQYMAEDAALARRVLAVLAAHGIPVWLDFATLLNQLRGQQLNRWEQDVDFSSIHPDYLGSMREMPLLRDGALVGPAWDEAQADPTRPGLALSKEHLMEKFTQAGFTVKWLPKSADMHTREAAARHARRIGTHALCSLSLSLCRRNLIQLWGPSTRGPHVDVWLWTPIPSETSEGSTSLPLASHQYSLSHPPWLWTAEGGNYNPRPFADIAPLVFNATWIGMPAPLPREAHRISAREYGSFGGSYMDAQVFRGDCFHNIFNLRFAY